MDINEPNSQEESQSQNSISESEPSSTIICPFCHQEHAIGTLFCPVTGKSLSEENVQSEQGNPPAPIQEFTSQPPAYPSPSQGINYPYPPRPPKDRSIAIILEILPGLFGILGIGWIYSGKTGVGLAWLIGYLIWSIIAVTAAVLTGFLACFCTVPVNLVCVGISTLALNSYIKNNPQLFGNS